MFDMHKIGKRIAALRMKEDMTQMELADRMGISFQAVSNWERGNSMPDISKLPVLAKIFEVSLDELLGEKSVLVEAVLEGRLTECVKKGEAEEAEMKGVLPILKPKQILNMAVNAEGNIVQIFLPFLDRADVVDMAWEAKEKGNDFAVYLPFIDESVVTDWARAEKKRERIAVYLPFLNKNEVADLAKEALQRGESITAYLPFLDKNDVKGLLKMVQKKV